MNILPHCDIGHMEFYTISEVVSKVINLALLKPGRPDFSVHLTPANQHLAHSFLYGIILIRKKSEMLVYRN